MWPWVLGLMALAFYVGLRTGVEVQCATIAQQFQGFVACHG